MDPIFHKAMVIGDLHFGRSGNSPQANQDNLAFLAWAIDEARTWGAEHCIMLGDWHDHRHSTGVGTMLASLDGMDMLNNAFMHVWWLTGNHDLMLRMSREAASIEFARNLSNIEIIRHPLTIGAVTFLPWLVGDEHKSLRFKSRYIFGHLELAGFLLNNKVVMPESAHTADISQFSEQEWVFSGHFHKRQIEKTICYIGNVMPFNFGDEDDADRGMMLLEWGRDPIFKSWPNQPLYRATKLSELLENVDSILKPDMTLRVAVDLPLQFEEAQEMREGLIAAYDLRKVELIHSRDEVDQDFAKSNIEFHSVDQLVIEGLSSIESTGLSKDRLIEIYTSL